MPGLPFNSIIEVAFRGSLISQRTLNVFHYRVLSPSSIPVVADEMSALTSVIANNTGTNLFSSLRAVTPDNYFFTSISAQPIFPVRWRRSVRLTAQSGQRTEATVTNLQASITLVTDFSGRSHVGGKRIALSQADTANGNVINTLQVPLNAVADACKVPITVTNGDGTYAPCLYRRNGQGNRFTDITGAFRQDTARVIRRRTVGLGE
jgi:hypothetical protein